MGVFLSVKDEQINSLNNTDDLGDFEESLMPLCMLVDGNAHLTKDQEDIFLNDINFNVISESLIPEIRVYATMIAAMRHDFNNKSPDVFTDEADWFAARMLVLNVRSFHLDLKYISMLKIANQRAEKFARIHNLQFTPAKAKFSIYANRPFKILIIEIEKNNNLSLKKNKII